MEARAVGHDSWAVQVVSREDSLQGDSQGSGSGFLYNIKRACCPCFVRAPEIRAPEIIELITPEGVIEINVRNEPRLFDRNIEQTALACLPVHATSREIQDMMDTVIEGIVVDIGFERLYARQQPLPELNQPEREAMERKSKIKPYQELTVLNLDGKSEIDKPDICCISEEEPHDMVYYAGRYYNYEMFISIFEKRGVDPFSQEIINWDEVYKVPVDSGTSTSANMTFKDSDSDVANTEV